MAPPRDIYKSSHATTPVVPHAVPSIDQFAKVLSQEPCRLVLAWCIPRYSLGVFLGAPSNDLDLIKHEYRGTSVTRCLIETYKRLGKAPSWDSIANNLRAIGNHSLSEHIDSTYIQPSLEPPSSSSEPGSINSEQSIASVASGGAQPGPTRACIRKNLIEKLV